MVLDGGSCTNAVSKDVVKKLDLKAKSHPNPYKVAWANNIILKVQERCLVSYSIAGFSDKVKYDIFPLKVCYILLGRPCYSTKRHSIVVTTTLTPSNTTI